MSDILDFSGGYKLTGTGWRILNALLAGPLYPEEIMRATDLTQTAVARELVKLDLAGHVDELTTGRYRIDPDARALAAKDCPRPKTGPMSKKARAAA